MLQPFPDTACRHHTPGGLANSSIAGTLQHIMQVPQARPGTRRGRSGVANSTPFIRSSSLRVYLQRTQYSVNAAAASRVGGRLGGRPPFATMLKSALLAPIVP